MKIDEFVAPNEYLINLCNKLIKDENYILLNNEYKKSGNININLLKKVVKDNNDLLIVFLKMNIVIYRKKFLKIHYEKVFDNLYGHKDIEFFSDDVMFIFDSYYKNYTLFKSCMQKIIENKLLDKNILDIIKIILKIGFDKRVIEIVENL